MICCTCKLQEEVEKNAKPVKFAYREPQSVNLLFVSLTQSECSRIMKSKIVTL